MYMSRRLAVNKANSAGNGSNAYEMSSGVISQPVYTTVQSGASAPAESTNAAKVADNGGTQPSAPPTRSSLQDITLIDNDLYQYPK